MAGFLSAPSTKTARNIAFGYRHDEVELPRDTPQKLTSHIKMSKQAIHVDLSTRPAVMVSVGCDVQGVTMPHPDPKDPVTMVEGVKKRFAARTPRPSFVKVRKLKRFVMKQLKSGRFGTPISPDEDYSFETWIAQVDYPDWRKDELKEVHRNMVDVREEGEKHFKCKSFMKDETYAEYKHARGINSRSDEFKVFSGPIFRLIEKKIFAAPEFIKKVPVAQRPAYIKERLYTPGGKYFSSDYTSYEALFESWIMEACEMQAYKYFTQALPNEWYDAVHDALTGEQHCQFKHFVASIMATRMSGDMCTSLGNGFSNLMFMEFVCKEKGSKCVGVVEGDDGLFRIVGCVPTEQDFAMLGLRIKCEEHTKLETASFCGLVFDIEDQINVVDPREVLASLAWMNSKYAGARDGILLDLLRCKGLSAAHQYPGCPIVSSLAQYALRVTRSRDVRNAPAMRHFSQWDREQLLDALAMRRIPVVSPPERTRLLVEQLYNISVETQLYIENYLDNLEIITQLDLSCLSFPESWHHYSIVYTNQSDKCCLLDGNWSVRRRDRKARRVSQGHKPL